MLAFSHFYRLNTLILGQFPCFSGIFHIKPLDRPIFLNYPENLHLGIGRNAHIGFNEPDDHFSKGTHQVALTESTIQANTRFFQSADEVPKLAYSVGMQAIMQARKILLVACGEDKAEALQRSFFGPVTPQIPASILQLHQDVTVIADTAALSLCPVTK